MNVLLSIPKKYAKAAYTLYAIGCLVMTYLSAKGLVGADEVALWSGLGVLFGFTATVRARTYDPSRGDD